MMLKHIFCALLVSLSIQRIRSEYSYASTSPHASRDERYEETVNPKTYQNDDGSQGKYLMGCVDYDKKDLAGYRREEFDNEEDCSAKCTDSEMTGQGHGWKYYYEHENKCYCTDVYPEKTRITCEQAGDCNGCTKIYANLKVKPYCGDTDIPPHPNRDNVTNCCDYNVGHNNEGKRPPCKPNWGHCRDDEDCEGDLICHGFCHNDDALFARGDATKCCTELKEGAVYSRHVDKHHAVGVRANSDEDIERHRLLGQALTTVHYDETNRNQGWLFKKYDNDQSDPFYKIQPRQLDYDDLCIGIATSVDDRYTLEVQTFMGFESQLWRVEGLFAKYDAGNVKCGTIASKFKYGYDDHNGTLLWTVFDSYPHPIEVRTAIYGKGTSCESVGATDDCHLTQCFEFHQWNNSTKMFEDKPGATITNVLSD